MSNILFLITSLQMITANIPAKLTPENGSARFQCSFAPKSSEVATLKGVDFSASILINSKSAKLLKCIPFPGAPQLVAAEIDLGVTGTTASSREIHLMIFEKLAGKTREIFDREIGTEMISFEANGKKNITRTDIPYELVKDKDGTPIVLWSNSRVPIALTPR